MKKVRKCSVCGQEHTSQKKVYFCKQYGDYLCNKHNMQLRQHGRFTDTTQRGGNDKNEYRIKDNIIEVDCYNQQNQVVATFTTNIEFLELIKAHKWRVTPKRNLLYVVTGNRRTSPTMYLHRCILGEKEGYEVDHIDGNPLNNCKENLRYATRQEQVGNLAPKEENKFGIRGISYDKRTGLYKADFALHKQRYYFKDTKTLEEAVYIRYLAEKWLNPLQRYNPKMDEYIAKLSEEQKQEIEKYVENRILKLQEKYGHSLPFNKN